MDRVRRWPVSTATSATVTGLVNGTSYDLVIAAVNLLGTGPASKQLSSIAPSDMTVGFLALVPVRLFDTRSTNRKASLMLPNSSTAICE